MRPCTHEKAKKWWPLGFLEEDFARFLGIPLFCVKHNKTAYQSWDKRGSKKCCKSRLLNAALWRSLDFEEAAGSPQEDCYVCWLLGADHRNGCENHFDLHAHCRLRQPCWAGQMLRVFLKCSMLRVFWGCAHRAGLSTIKALEFVLARDRKRLCHT